MAKYVGKRIVPLPCGEWVQNREYEMLSVVLHTATGDSYMARRQVPAGTAITDKTFWVKSSEWSQQIKNYSDQLTETLRQVRADNDATEQAIRQNNTATETSIRQDNDATEQAIFQDNSNTRYHVDEVTGNALQEMNHAKQSFDLTSEALINRMNSIVGSVTSDTEILDARVDSAGNTYANLGEAIRSIVPLLRSSLISIDTSGGTLADFDWEQYKYVDKTSNEIKVGGDSVYISGYIRIPDTCYKIVTNAYKTGIAWTVAFFDEQKGFISGLQKSNEANQDYVITEIPQNAKYLIVTEHNYSGSVAPSNVYVKLFTFERIDNIEDAIKTMLTSLNAFNDSDTNTMLSWTNAKRLNVTGDIVNATESFNLSQAIPIRNDSFYEIGMEGLYGIEDGSTYAFYDVNLHPIPNARGAVNGKFIIEADTVPSNAAYLYICHYTTGEHTSSDVSVILRHNRRIDAIEGDVACTQDEIDEVSNTLNIDTSHKNILAGATTFKDNQFINDQGIVVSNSNFCLIDGYFPVKPNTTYKLYRDEPSLYSNSGHNWTWWDENKGFISYVLSGSEETSPENAAFLRFAVYISSTGLVTHNTFDPTNVTITEDGKPFIDVSFTRGFTSRSTMKGLKWIGIGDSITEDNFRAAYHYHDYIKAETGMTFVNLGISGTGYKAEGSGDKAFYKRILSMERDADVITIFGGVNDVVLSNADIGTETDTGTSTICGCVNETLDVIEELYPAHMPIGIISPLPCHCIDTRVNLNPYQNPNDDTCRMAVFVEQLGLICKHRGIPFLDLFHQSNLRPWNEECREKYFSCDAALEGDGLHPNGHGHRLIYRQIMQFVEKLAMR